MAIVTLGLDLGKNWIHMVGFDEDGGIVLRRRVRRNRLLAQTANMPACLIGMEACCGTHHLGRSLEAQGHTARLMPPQYMKSITKIRRGGKKSIPHESRLDYNCACLLYATDGLGNCLIAGPISGTNVGA